MKQVIYFYVFAVVLDLEKTLLDLLDLEKTLLDLLDLEKTWRYWRKPGEDLEILETILDTH